MTRAIVLAVALLAAACGSTSSAEKAPPPPPAMPVQILTVAPTPVRDTTEYIATLRSRRSIAVQPQVDGQVTRVFVKSGDRVAAGRPLMQIDPARQQASLSAARATHASRRAALALAEQELTRTRYLLERGAIAAQQLDQAQAAVDSLRAEVDALGAGIRTGQVELAYTRVTAPADGVVGDIPVRIGDRVTPATVLTTLDDNRALEAYVSIPVARAADVALGTEIDLVDRLDQTVSTGRVQFVSPQVNPETQSVLVKADVTNPTALLRAEQFVRARVVWGAHDGLVVPALAVVRMNGQSFVFVADGPPGKLVAAQRPITLGDLVDNRYVVVSGLSAGDKVIVSAVQKLRPGAAIAIQPQS